MALASLFPTQADDPFYPQNAHFGPAFLDTEACLCTLQPNPSEDEDDTAAMWQCIGDQSQDIYQITSGKWFRSMSGSSIANGTIDDSSKPPDQSQGAFVFNNETMTFDEKGDTRLPIRDDLCTAQNHTTFSTSYYQAYEQLQNEQQPTAAAPCWRYGSFPLQIDNGTFWEPNGCSAGFLCVNNTINSLPQYCPPFTWCQTSRLAGRVCNVNDTNIPMGPFEPIVCLSGNYCPKEEEGRRSIICPEGSYCQPGAATPTPCGAASLCPEGSANEVPLLPLILVLVIDVALVVLFFFLSLRRRFRLASQGHLSTLGNKSQANASAGSRMRAQVTGYKALSDEHDDQEAFQMDHSYVPGGDGGYGGGGYEAAVAMETMRANQPTTKEQDDELPPQLRPFVASMRKATDATSFGLSFGYTGLNFHPKGVARPILQNVTGRIDRGSLVAVMGGSGAGKSTFVNVLMGKVSHTGGAVTVNGEVVKIKRFRKLIGYVPQDDIVLPELTVFENILHSAKIRLPRTWSSDDVRTHVDSVIECLELSHVRDSLVGSVAKPVLSGGQRKRVSIGMELAAAPMAIFLDEPTSGLDATAASSIMRTLKALARLGISVIVIIHQPRVEIFNSLDNLILLGNGQTIYEGPQHEVQGYFQGLGFVFPEHANNGDVITDIITGNGRDYKRAGDISKDALITNWASVRQERDRQEHLQPGETDNSDASSFRLSSLVGYPRPTALKNRGALRPFQLWLNLKRSILQQERAIGSFVAEMGLSALAGILLGLAEYSKHGVLFTGIYNPPYDMLSVATDFRSAPEMALLVAIAVGLVSGAPGVKVFSEEMLLQRRESEAGHSRIAYFIAKVIAVLPRMLLACLHFTTPLFCLSTPIMGWDLALLVNLLYFYCIYGLASIISMIVRREDAPLFATMLALITGILSGSAPPLRQVKDWNMEWLWRASPGTWLAEVYFGQLVEPFTYLYDTKLAAEAAGFNLNGLWVNILVLAAIGTLYRVIAFLLMVFLPKLKK
jgi:ABC-type multidrug transport system ATPase subunit